MSDRDDNPSLSRKELLRAGAFRAKQGGAYVAELALERLLDRVTPHVQRPPGALPEIEFLVACTRCGECSTACPPGAILTLDHRAGAASGTPFLDVNRHRPCVLCTDAPCMPACPTGALQVIPVHDAVMGTAKVARDQCTAWLGESCVRCSIVCPLKSAAIVVDTEGRPWVDPRGCTGCGLCVAVCPTTPKSIEVEAAPRV